MARANDAEAGLDASHAESAPALPLAQANDESVEGSADGGALLERCNGAQLASLPCEKLQAS